MQGFPLPGKETGDDLQGLQGVRLSGFVFGFGV